MGSEPCASIIDWLSDVEASAHWQDSSLRDSSLPCATPSTPTQSSPSLSSPCFTGLQDLRKRKHHPDSPQFRSKKLHFDRRTREALCEIMQPNNTKRRRTDTEGGNDEQVVGLEARTINLDTVWSYFLTIISSIVLLKHPKKANPPPRPNQSYRRPLPPCRTQRPQVAPGRRLRPP